MEIVHAYLTHEEADTTLQMDFEYLKTESDPRVRFCILYRIERKKILHSQMHLCQILIDFMNSEWKAKQDYMRMSPLEETAKETASYFLRRLKCRNYLKQVF